MPRTRRLLPIALALLAFPASAPAECMMIQPFVVPADAEVVPPDPRLILFWPLRAAGPEPQLAIEDGAGRPVAFTLELLSWTPAYAAHALQVKAKDGTRFTVRSAPAGALPSASYRVDAGWRKPAELPWTWRTETSSFSWRCSFERVTIVEIPRRAPAYRVEWRPAGAAGWRSLVTPSLHAWFFSQKGPRPAGDEIRLGHANCTGWNFRWDDPAIVARAVALHLDGSEDPPSPEFRIEAPPRVEGRQVTDSPDDLRSPLGAWEAMLSALWSGRVAAVRRVCTPAGWEDLRRTLGSDPARLAQAGTGWARGKVRWLPNEGRSAEVRWGPEIKEHAFRFVEQDGAWRLDGHSPGE